MLVFISLLVFVLINCCNGSLPENFVEKLFHSPLRLPGDLKPMSYVLDIDPTAVNIFIGKVTIQAVTLKSTSIITLHNNGLFDVEIDSVLENNIKIQVTNITFDIMNQMMSIHLQSSLSEGNNVTMDISYKGYLSDAQLGFYSSNYTDGMGNVKWLATTHFQPLEARRAFPCFDEPKYKATFKIAIRRKEHQKALSNGRLISTELIDPDIYRDVFEETPLLPTYLVAFTISEFTSQTSEDGRVTIYGRPERISDGRAAFILSHVTDFLRSVAGFTNFPVPENMKIDLIGLPDESFLPAAMENWGLLVFKEFFLYYNQSMETAEEKDAALRSVAHEVTHIWFSGLLSFEWWNNCWLNEGFATYFEYYSPAIFQWSMWLHFPLKVVQDSLEKDATVESKPLSYNMSTIMEFYMLFDYVAYNKSAAIVRMVEHIVSTPIFKKAVQTYVANRAYNLVTEFDLWRSLQTTIDDAQLTLPYPIETIMTSWTMQSSYPLITASKQADNTIKVTQQRFYSESVQDPVDQTWIVPISYTTSNKTNFEDTSPKFWLKDKDGILDGVALQDGEWIILNMQQTGFYRVNYDENLWLAILDKLSGDTFTDIHVNNRAQLIDDILHLCRSGTLSYLYGLKLLKYLKREVDYIPLYSFYKHLTFLNKAMYALPEYADFKNLVLDILIDKYHRLGTEELQEETDYDKMHRITVLNWLCYYDFAECLDKMNQKLITWEPIPPNLQDPVYCGGLKNHNDQEWHHLVNLLKDNKTERFQKFRIISGLACSSDPFLQEILLKPNDFIPPQNQVSAFESVYSNSMIGLNTALNYLINNFEDLKQRFSTYDIQYIFDGISQRATTADHILKIETFISTLTDSDLEDFGVAIAIAEKNLADNKEWIARNKVDIQMFFHPRAPMVREKSEQMKNKASRSNDSFIGIIFVVYVIYHK